MHDSTSHSDLSNKHVVELSPLWQFQQNLRYYNLGKVEFMAEPLSWIALDCIGVPNKVISKCILSVLLSMPFIFIEMFCAGVTVK